MLLNPVVISVLVMGILCLLKLNVMLSMIIAALVAGCMSGLGLAPTMKYLIVGMGGNSETALSYILLGTLAVAISQTGLATIMSKKIAKLVNGRKKMLVLLIAFIACFSQNLIPVHIAFIPILIPPLLKMMNKLKIDRRAVACALTFGLKVPYIVFPVGFGLIFHTIVKEQLNANGYNISLEQVWKANWFLGIAMILGLLIAVFVSYRKDREYQDLPLKGFNEEEDIPEKMTKEHWITLGAAILAFAVQLVTGSLPLGAIAALAMMVAFKVIKWHSIDELLNGGVLIMGLIAFIMLVAAGYGNVIRETNAIPALVESVIAIIGTNKTIAAFVMLVVGLFVSIGLGSSFGTIPILAVIYCPLALKLGFSPTAMVILITTAGALGDAGSPASDSTLGPTSGLNADGQHNHITDTCIPTFTHYTVMLFIFGLVGSIIF